MEGGGETDAQGVRDAATVLPFAAAALLLPPAILIFATPLFVSGIPLIVVYLFGVWAAIILSALLVARRLAENDVPADREPPKADGPG